MLTQPQVVRPPLLLDSRLQPAKSETDEPKSEPTPSIPEVPTPPTPHTSYTTKFTTKSSPPPSPLSESEREPIGFTPTTGTLTKWISLG